ncbi:hypothetical protein FKM82_010496 [Ascaphus truei]
MSTSNNAQIRDEDSAAASAIWNEDPGEHLTPRDDEMSTYNTRAEDRAAALPDCWNMKQVEVFQKNDHVVQQASLRKKMNEHFSSQAHGICVSQLKCRTDDVITKCIDKINQKYISSQYKKFNTVYSIAKRNRQFSDIEDEIELQAKNGLDAETIHKTLLKSLCEVGFDIEYLINNVVAFCSDGASVMLGCKSGMILITEIKQVNHFKMFIDKIYTIFHQSNKNQMALFKISEELALEITKIGRVWGPRWTACCLRSTLAVWQIALLSNALKNRNLNLVRAEKLIKRSIRAVEMLKESCGNFEKKIDSTINSDGFKYIDFVENKKYVNLPRQKLLETVISNMKARLMDSDHLKSGYKVQNSDRKIHEIVNTLEPDCWHIDEVVVLWKAAEEKLCDFNKFFHHEININDFRDFVEKFLKNRHNHEFPILGGSTMNNIYSDKRSRLPVQNVANLITIIMIGLPLDSWDPTPSVQTWLRINLTDNDNRVKHGQKKQYNDNKVPIWKYFKEGK